MKFIVLLLILSMTLSASYVKMLDYYKKGEYQNVLKEARISHSEYENPELHLLWAKSAEKLGHITESMGAYERVLILDENNKEVQKRLSQVYEDSNRIGVEKEESTLKAHIDIAFGHDDNLNVNPGGDILDEYYGVLGNSGIISSNFMRVTGNINYTQHLNDEGWFVKGILNMYDQENFSAHTYNFLMGTLSLSLGYTGSDEYSVYLPVYYDNIHYLDKNLMERYRILPRIIIPLFEYSYLDFNAIYKKIDYLNNRDKKYDSTTWGFGTGIYFPIYSNFAHLNFNYEKRRSDSNLVSRFINAHFFKMDADIEHVFSDDLFAEFTYKLRYGKYDDMIGTDLIPNTVKRTDYFHQLDLKLGYLVKKDIELYIKNTYIKNNSNHILTEYNKNIFMFGIDLSY